MNTFIKAERREAIEEQVMYERVNIYDSQDRGVTSMSIDAIHFFVVVTMTTHS